MKKTILVLQLALLDTLLYSSFVSAANPALVPSVRDNALLSLSIGVDDNPVSVFVYSSSPTTTYTNEKNFELAVSGELERSKQQTRSLEALIATDEIVSNMDLENYIKTLVRNNPNINSVAISGNRITMTRTTSGMLFGLVTMRMEETAEVTNWGDGTSAVNVSRPWWGTFLTEYTDDAVANNLYTRIKTIPSSLFVTTLDVNTQGRIVTEMDGAFKENYLSTKE